MSRPCDCKSINLSRPTLDMHIGSDVKRPLTVFTVNTPITLSHAVPEFGCQLSSLDNALARWLTRSRTSTAEYSAPVMPQVNGGLESCIGYRPCFSLNMNSWMGIVCGGSRSLGIHEGDVKTIVLEQPCLSQVFLGRRRGINFE